MVEFSLLIPHLVVLVSPNPAQGRCKGSDSACLSTEKGVVCVCARACMGGAPNLTLFPYGHLSRR